jgi:hypothetical protein
MEVMMKLLRLFCIALFIAILGISGLEAEPFKSMSLNGSTGLYSIPSGRVGWESPHSIGLDFGYHAIISDGKAAHIPKLGLSLFKWVELNAAFDFQPDRNRDSGRGTDFIGGLKLQFPITSTAIALGGNFQSLNMGSKNSNNRYIAGQVYAAVTYAGQFFNMPAETTLVMGKTFVEDNIDSNIDVGMGFDLILLPDVFQRYVHWIIDFSNFSYSVEPYSARAGERGLLNIGLRIDLGAIPALDKFKFAIDVLMTDAFDKNRGFSAGLVFGLPVR